MPLPNVNRTTLLNPGNLSFMVGDEELVHPTPLPPPPPQPYLGTSSSSQASSSRYYTDIHATLQSM